MNKVTIAVDEIRSYQTLVYKNGRMTFTKKDYLIYKEQLIKGMKMLKKIKPYIPIKLELTFNLCGGVSSPVYRVKMISSGNTSRKFNTEQEALDFMDDDKHYLDVLMPEVKYGSIGDVDNISKPIIDTLEEYAVIKNDRYVTELNVIKTYGNKENSITIEIQELDHRSIINNDN